jgi:hypothetical protein
MLLLLSLLTAPTCLYCCTVQVVNQPGLEDVFADLLEYEDRTGEELGAELYMEHCPPHLEGEHTPVVIKHTFGAAQCTMVMCAAVDAACLAEKA